MIDRPSIELDSWSLFQKYGFQDGDIIIHLIEEIIGVQNNPKFRYYDNGSKFIEQFIKKHKDKLDPDIKEFLTYFRDDIDLDDKLLLDLLKDIFVNYYMGVVLWGLLTVRHTLHKFRHLIQKGTLK
ncbi:MAG: hypothetical protein ACFFCZ_26425 [Promethearchaeota archaeon]